MAELVVVRHGETAWSRAGRRTGRVDVPLTVEGRRQAAKAASGLRPWMTAVVWVSPLGRAIETARCAGFGPEMTVVDDLVEWDYGDLEGLTVDQIRADRPGWNLWNDGAPGGENVQQVSDRVDRVVAEARSVAGPIVVFSHENTLRVLAARWVDQPGREGRCLATPQPASIGVLSEEDASPVISRWSSP